MNVSRPLGLTLLALALTLASARANDPVQSMDARFQNGIAAIVENKVVTVEDVKRELRPLVQQVRMQARNQEEFRAQIDQLQQEIVQTLVDRLLLAKEFDRKEMKVPASFIETEFEETLARDFEGDRARFLAYLRDRGITASDFRRELEDRIKVGYMRNRMFKSETFISPMKIEAYYQENQDRFVQEDEVRLRLIRLSQLADESEDVLNQTAKKILDQLAAGASFADLARQHSQDARARQGGDWGWIKRPSLQTALAEAAFALKPGQSSAPIRVGKDLFILFVEERKHAGTQPLDAVRGEIERILSTQAMRESQERMLERLRTRFFVRYF